MIPPILRRDDLKFCRLKKGTKKPFEQDWTNKPYTWQEIETFLPDENYGVLCGYGGLAVIDCDNPILQTAVENLLPETYRVKTGSGGTHNYFFVPELQQKVILETDNGIHLGEVQSKGTQVVAPGSIHPNGNVYEEINQKEIATLSYSQLIECFKPFMKEIKETEENSLWERKEHSEIDNLNVTDIWSLSSLKKHGNEYYGEHPTHGSETGTNFWVNPLKNTWHCFRCNSGGGPLSAIAVKEGILSCSEAQKGVLRGDKARRAIEIAREKYGLKLKEEIELLVQDEDKIKIIWDKDLPNYKEEEKEWIVDKLIPNRSVCILTGKRGSLKTFIALLLSYCVSNGTSFLGQYNTNKGGVIYLDKENGIPIMKNRTKMIKNGLGISMDSNVGFICFSQLKIDKLIDIGRIEEVLKEYNPKLLVIDTYRRGISFDENDAGEVSKLFVDILRPLVEKNNISILLIHHDRKGESSGDEMDMIRGSSDLANYADIILKMERKGNTLSLKQLKNRNAQEENPIGIKFESTEDSIKLSYGGELEPQTQADKCVEILSIWIAENGLKQFSTKGAKDIAFGKGIKKSNLFNALESMVSLGQIKNIGWGLYEVVQ